ncbi:PLC-like phosphodiesterase [Rhodofomes roseus]|uniref:PLC-like phosphodiesterase n=1 Tax=Rhodofomes roseus TaxID=34475 RepID=A0ABQ8K844_9APHY|nr:PLC-like phosphodiesterase [Rhodofomes roseus]KAH9833462.1 PLC-like phosphodiesterase [Rhodofomes roseus]
MPPKIPECWGHRGASVAFPENTLASFERAIRDGADGIETDVHISQDDVVIMFHDPTLQRTTNGFGMIKEHKWYGPNGMQQLRTKKEPKQPIPTFDETIALFMRPENRHAKLHIDIKPSNSLGKIFALMARTIRAYDAWETALAPRILLGVWHTNYVRPAMDVLPRCGLAHIGFNVSIARTWFWDSCEVISLHFTQWTTRDGQRLLKECKAAGKTTMVWTVNNPLEMAEAIRWGIDVIMTDVPHILHALRRDLEADWNKTLARYPRTFLWKHHRYYWPVTLFWATFVRVLLQAAYGRLGKVAPAARRALDVVDEIGAPPPDISKTGNGYTVTENGGVVNGDAAPKAVADADGDYPNRDVPQ